MYRLDRSETCFCSSERLEFLIAHAGLPNSPRICKHWGYTDLGVSRIITREEYLPLALIVDGLGILLAQVVRFCGCWCHPAVSSTGCAVATAGSWFCGRKQLSRNVNQVPCCRSPGRNGWRILRAPILAVCYC